MLRSKRTFRLLGLAALALATLWFGSCDLLFPPTVTIEERLNSFVADLNLSDRSELYLNLDSGAASYNLAKTSAYWDAIYAPDGTYTLGTLDKSNPLLIKATLSSTGSFGSQELSFTMKATAGVYYILGISNAGTPVFF